MKYNILCAAVCLIGFFASMPSLAACPQIPAINRTPTAGSPFATGNRDVTRMDTQTSDNVRITGGCVDWPGLGLAVFDPVKQHQAPIDGVSDAAAQINAALAACSGAGGGRVVMQPRRYVVTSADLDVPAGCTLEMSGPTMHQDGPNNIAQPALVLATTRTINLSGSLRHIAVFQQGIGTLTGVQDTYNQVNAFSGTAVTTQADDTQIEDALIVGFGTCIDNTNHQRPYFRHLRLYCKNGINFDEVHDVAHVSDVHGWPFFFANSGFTNETQTITGAADNGAGLIRLTVGSTADLATGNPITVRGVGGFLGANGNWTITVVDGTHVDLQGSNSTSVTATGTFASDETMATVPSLAGIWYGMDVAGTNIAGGTTVRTIDWDKKAVWLSAATTGAGPQTLTFSSGAYTSGGTLFFDATSAPLETFISVTNSEETHFTDIFQYGWNVGYYVGAEAIWATFVSASCDSFDDPTRICMLWDSTSRFAQWIGGEGGGNGVTLVDKSTRGVNSVIGVSFREGKALYSTPYVTASLQGSGDSQLRSILGSGTNAASITGNIMIYSGAGKKSIGGIMPHLDIYPQNRSVARDLMILAPDTVLDPASPFSYKQANFTPALQFGGASAGTYVAQQGQALLQWPYMLADFSIKLSAKSANTGVAAITGLPASCGASPSGSGVALVNFDPSVGLTGAPYVKQVDSSSTLTLVQTAAAAPASITDANFANDSGVRGSFRCMLLWTQR